MKDSCRDETEILTNDELTNFGLDLGGNWKIINEHHLEKEYIFANFKEALAFTNKVGTLAEMEKHHPSIHLSWGKVRILIWTHSVNGLTKKDFTLAAKCDQIL